MAHDILLSITGMTPQVVTETLFGIYKEEPTNFPEEIYIITTTKGAELIEQKLLGENGQLRKLCNDYNLPQINFDKEKHLKIITDNNGYPIDDARSKEDQKVIADFISNMVKNLTEKKDDDGEPFYRIHASLAGGRKTMTYLLGSAMNIYCNNEDKLSHVLVSVENPSREFFYPTLESCIQKDFVGNEYDAKDVEIEMSEIPLIRLRSILQKNKNFATGNYNDAVLAINETLAIDPKQIKLNLNYATSNLEIIDQSSQKEYSIHLTPKVFAVYRMHLENLKKIDTFAKSAKISDTIKYYINIFKYLPIDDDNYRNEINNKINKFLEKYGLTQSSLMNTTLMKENTDFITEFVESINFMYEQYCLKCNLKKVSVDLTGDKNYNLQHPYSILGMDYNHTYTSGDYTHITKTFLDSQNEFFNNRIKDIRKAINKEINCEELANIIAIRKNNTNGCIDVPIDNITINGKPFKAIPRLESF